MSNASDVFDHHLEAFGSGDLEDILTDYTEQTIMIYGDRVWRGLDGAREFFTMWLSDLLPAGSQFDLIDRHVVDDWVYITWTAESEETVFDYGTDTFLIRDGKIMRQTVAGVHHKK